MASFALSAAADAAPVQPWPDMLISAPVTKDWLVSGEVVGRVADDARTSQIETRAQVGHVLSKRLTVWAGWVHFANFNPHARNGWENQAVEQLNWAIGAIGPVRVSTRTRLEQRFLSGVDQTSWRWRQQVRLSAPLGGRRAPSAVLWAEPFLGLNRTTGQTHTLDQLRLFAGFAMPVSAHLDLEVGYLNQRIYRANQTIVNDAVPINLTLHF